MAVVAEGILEDREESIFRNSQQLGLMYATTCVRILV